MVINGINKGAMKKIKMMHKVLFTENEETQIMLVNAHGNGSFMFPSVPASVQVNESTKYQNYDTIGLGSLMIPKGTNVGTISFSGTFFGESRKESAVVQRENYKTPEKCREQLEKWIEKGTVLLIAITTGSGTRIISNVTIQSFNWEAAGAHGDYNYSITFAKYKAVLINTVKIKKPSKSSESSSNSGKTYVIKAGDSLWKIAQKKLGNANRYNEIYLLNKKTLNATAKKYGYKSCNNGSLIFTGDKIILP